MVEELRIQTRVYQLMQWLLPKAERFPRLYRSTVTQRMMDSTLDLHESLTFASLETGSARKRHLKQADARLSFLRVYLRLITDWHWLNLSQHEHVSGLINEIGRMLGAWIKTA